MGGIDPLAALARQQKLAAAARDALDGALPGLTHVDAALPPQPVRETNPIPLARPGGAPGGALSRGARPVVKPGTRPLPGVDAALPPLTQRYRASPPARSCETNPIAAEASATLPPRHLAAARLLARGRTVSAAAAELFVSRQAVWRWSRNPAFAAELRRLHEVMARSAERRER